MSFKHIDADKFLQENPLRKTLAIDDIQYSKYGNIESITFEDQAGAQLRITTNGTLEFYRYEAPPAPEPEPTIDPEHITCDAGELFFDPPAGDGSEEQAHNVTEKNEIEDSEELTF